MIQQVTLVTLGIQDVSSSKNFYMNGFGWEPFHETLDTVMYQMNGFVLSTWLQSELEKDVTVQNLLNGGGITLAHNVSTPGEVQLCLDKLARHGGKILRNADAPGHGGMRGYISDPDNHIWEVIYNSDWKVDKNGYVTFNPAK